MTRPHPPPPATFTPQFEALFRAFGHTPHAKTPPAASGGESFTGSDDERVRRARLYLAKLPPSIQHQNGSGDLMRAARSLVWGFAIEPDAAAEILVADFNPRCDPPWAEGELIRACDRAAEGGENPRGWLLADSPDFAASRVGRHAFFNPDDGGIAVPLILLNGLTDLPGGVPPNHLPPPSPPPAAPPLSGGPSGPESERPTLRPGVEEDDPEYLADLLLHRHSRPDGVTLRSWNDRWYLWDGGVYRLLESSEAEDLAAQSTSAEFDRRHHARANSPVIRAQEAAGANVERSVAPKSKVTIPLIRNVLFNARNRAAVRSKVEPCWVDCSDPPVGTMIAFPNGILDLSAHLRGESDDSLPLTPRYFTRSRLDFDFDPNPPPPIKWHAFLRQVWPDDRDSITLLQQWFGYVLSRDNSRQKFLGMTGAKNGGKGVICNVMRGMVGTAVTASPTLKSLSGDFGLAALDGKSLAVVGDMRVSPKTDVNTAVEHILNITGGDFSTINAKNKAEYEAKLSNRFVLASNGLPKLFDTSAALIRRTLMLRFTVSFSDDPDTTLADTLRTELSGIFAWAVDGLRLLLERNKFTQPASGQELIDQFKAMMSDHSNFIADRCVIDPESWESYERLYSDWKEWCSQDGKKECGTKTSFKGKMLEVIPSLVVDHRPRVNNPDRKEGFKGVRLKIPHELSDI